VGLGQVCDAAKTMPLATKYPEQIVSRIGAALDVVQSTGAVGTGTGSGARDMKIHEQPLCASANNSTSAAELLAKPFMFPPLLSPSAHPRFESVKLALDLPVGVKGETEL